MCYESGKYFSLLEFHGPDRNVVEQSARDARPQTMAAYSLSVILPSDAFAASYPFFDTRRSTSLLLGRFEVGLNWGQWRPNSTPSPYGSGCALDQLMDW